MRTSEKHLLGVVLTLSHGDGARQGTTARSVGSGSLSRPGPAGAGFVGWGNLNAVSEFDKHGRLVYDARFPTGTNTYRAYLLPWSGGSARR